MTNHSTFHIFLITIILLAGCSKQSRQIKRLQWCTMGTIAAIQSTDLETAQKLRTIASDEFSVIENELSAWNPDSTLSKINERAGSNEATPVSATFTNLLSISTEVSRLSDSAFNPLLGPVLHAWGFNGSVTPKEIPPQHDLIKALLITDIDDIQIETKDSSPAILLTHSGMQLDFGAVAKGYAVDLAWQRAKQTGLSNVLIDLGGNLRAMGEAKPGRGGWLTGVKNPFKQDSLIAKLMIYDGEAIATSGNYERFVEINGERCAHIIDGRTAMPVKGMASVTVVSPDAATADALSTTLFILGVDAGRKLLELHYPDSMALWIPDQQPAQIIATEKMKKRLQP